MKRLVSAIYLEFYPFDVLFPKAEKLSTSNPDDLKAGDVLIVWGGEDISPSLYNKGRSSFTSARITPSRRDVIEFALMTAAKRKWIPIIGICRGAQMLCALDGNILYQHVNGHAGKGHMVNTIDNQQFSTNSIHHQMMVPVSNHVTLAWTPPRSDVYVDVDEDGEELLNNPIGIEVDPEFVHFPDVNGWAIQWHPEMMPVDCPATKYIFNAINPHV